MRKFRFIVTMAIVAAFSVTLALLSRKLFMDKAEDKKLKDLITTEETRNCYNMLLTMVSLILTILSTDTVELA